MFTKKTTFLRNQFFPNYQLIQCNHNQNHNRDFAEINKIFLTTWKCKGPRRAKTNGRGEDKDG